MRFMDISSTELNQVIEKLRASYSECEVIGSYGKQTIKLPLGKIEIETDKGAASFFQQLLSLLFGFAHQSVCTSKIPFPK